MVGKIADEPVGKREASRALQDLKIITAISMGKDRNKELAKVLDTDKSFAAKKVKDLEERGLVQKNGEGKEIRYSLVSFNVLKFLQSKVVITVKKPLDVGRKESGAEDKENDKRRTPNDKRKKGGKNAEEGKENED